MEEPNKELKLDDLKDESRNENEERQQQKPIKDEIVSTEHFHFEDGKTGDKLLLGSAAYDVFQLAELARQFLKLSPLNKKKTPPYLK